MIITICRICYYIMQLSPVASFYSLFLSVRAILSNKYQYFSLVATWYQISIWYLDTSEQVDLDTELVPKKVSLSNSDSKHPSPAFDKNLTTALSILPDSQGNVWIRVSLEGSSYVYEIIYYYVLPSKEDNGNEHCYDCVQLHTDVTVDVNANNRLVKSCGTLSLSPEEHQQLHRLLCRADADEVCFHKIGNEMLINEILVTGKCKCDQFVKYVKVKL